MHSSVLVAVAVALDALPLTGRVMLLALMLSLAFFGLQRVLRGNAQGRLPILFCKGALLSLLGAPIVIVSLGIQVPVPVSEVVVVSTPWPGYLVWGLASIWLAGAVYWTVQSIRSIRQTRGLAMTYRRHRSTLPDGLPQRLSHWQHRLNLTDRIELSVAGAEQGWHVGSISPGQSRLVCLPAAAEHWPTGLQDVLLLQQLALLQQGGWRWLVYGRWLRGLYWPLPWVASLVDFLALQLYRPAQELAASAYRDPEGWAQHQRALRKRAGALSPVYFSATRGLIRVPGESSEWSDESAAPVVAVVTGPGLRSRVSGCASQPQSAKLAKRRRERDPLEQVYWMIALVSILTGAATTLTQVPMAPEFEPQFLQIKWQEQMLPRLRGRASASMEGLDDAQRREPKSPEPTRVDSAAAEP